MHHAFSSKMADKVFKLISSEEVAAHCYRKHATGSYVDLMGFCRVMPPPLLLYRLRCPWPVEVQHGHRYKWVWSVTVVHNATGEILEFDESKAGASVRPRNLADHPKQQFVTDAMELLNLLYDHMCPHPYDGYIAA